MKYKKIKPHQIENYLNKNYTVIGVAGPMAAGKNYICNLLEQKGWYSIDADLLVHNAINKASQLIFETFGELAEKKGLIIKNSDGSINRRNLGQLLFSDSTLLQKQESIVYPIITKDIEEIISKNQKVILNATLLYKTPDLLSRCQALLFVNAPFVKRYFRAKKRDILPFKQIIRRFYSQKNLLKNYKTALQNSDTQIILIKN
ncbi:MAG: dephospho-CoA kinase [Treponema sp.]|nr:dephospho-CoA kinase [Treponema sp.]